jgi:hypothetical protein
MHGAAIAPAKPFVPLILAGDLLLRAEHLFVTANGGSCAMDRWRYVAGRPIVTGDDRARACPLRQLQETFGWGVLPYLPPEQHAKIRPSADVTAVTTCYFEHPTIFWTA